jgi:hypothetical protein
MDATIYHGVAVADRIATGIFELTHNKLSMQMNDNRDILNGRVSCI